MRIIVIIIINTVMNEIMNETENDVLCGRGGVSNDERERVKSLGFCLFCI